MSKSDLLFAFGALCVAAGVALIYMPAGVIVLGVFAIAGAVLTALADVARARRGPVELEAVDGTADQVAA